MAASRIGLGAICVALALAFAVPQGLAVENADAVAVVIGNRDYRGDRIPKVEYARRDADAMRDYLVHVLGYREGNIIDLRNATQAEMTAAFGNERSYQGKLWQYVRPGESDVTVYYSGHGVPGLKDRRGYLLPVDADPERPEINGYPLDVLYKNLEQLKAHSVTVYLDACFSGDSGGGMLIRGASGVTIVPKLPTPTHGMAVITAARKDEVASWDEQTRHGLFTSYLLEALNGQADTAKYGNGDGRVTLAELREFLDREMTYAARRRYGRIQEASLSGPDDALLGLVPETPVQTAAPVLSAPVVPPATTVADPAVREAQQMLAALGYDPGPADGLMGSRTRSAIESFQRSHGLAVDGAVSDILLAGLKVAQAQMAAVTPAPAPAARMPASDLYGRYHALVLGIGHYTDFKDVPTAAGDARAIAGVLRDTYGFEVAVLADADHRTVLGGLASLKKTLSGTDNVLVFYSGITWTDREAGKCYWLPADASRNNRANWVETGTVMDALKGAKHVMVIAHGCFEDTTSGMAQSASGSPLKADEIRRLAAKRARVALTSGGPPVSSSRADGRSVFAGAIIDALESNNGVLHGELLFFHIRRVSILEGLSPAYVDVRGAGHEGGDFLFVRGATNPRAVAARPAPAPAAQRAAPAVGVFPKTYKPGDTFKDCADCPEMVVVPAGAFDMGDLSGDGRDDEKPVHRVSIPRPFAVGKFEVTQAEWVALMGSHPSTVRDDRNPVEQVSWNDVQEFLKRLNGKTGREYRLLSEAEWEYAARAASRSKYPWGDAFDSSKTSFDRLGWGQHVGSYGANAFGLYDMAGSAWEWIEDCWHDTYDGAPGDGSAWTGGDCSRRVLRSGGGNDPSLFRSAQRSVFGIGDGNQKGVGLGLRVARTLDLRELKATVAPSSETRVATTAPTPARVIPPKLPATPLPAFKPGQVFRDCVGGSGALVASAGTELPSGATFCGPEMVVVPAGSFEMGSPPDETGRDNDEGPVHRVRIPRSFAVGVYEVTRAEWATVMGDNSGLSKDPRVPKEVSWDKAQEFTERLSAMTGKRYRLLSEAEWEYVARAGSRTMYPWGDEIDSSKAKYGSKGGAVPVGRYAANAFGLYDTVGNVWEWVEDCYHDSYNGAPTDGSAWTNADCPYHVLRSGLWAVDPRYVRSAVRSKNSVDFHLSYNGIRLAREL